MIPQRSSVSVLSLPTHDHVQGSRLPTINSSAAPALQPTSSTTHNLFTNPQHRPHMARYIVKVTSGDQTASLLVVLSPSQLCSALMDIIKSRLPTVASKLGLADTNEVHLTLHIDTKDGPMLDTKDLLSDVLPDAKGTVYAVIDAHAPQLKPVTSSLLAQPLSLPGKQLKLRVVTPELAHTEIDSVAPVSKPLALTTTLLQLKHAICQRLAVAIKDDPLQELDCNCSAARQIEINTALNEHGSGDSDTLHTLVVVYEDNKVIVITIQEPTLASIQRAVREQLQEKATGKLLCAIGGLENRDVQAGGNGKYLKLPILAVCSRTSPRHQNSRNSMSDTTTDDRGLTLDLHTSECPIDITTHNKDFTIAAAGLEDCAIDGVLTIFAVQRVYSTNDDHGSDNTIAGKAAIFQKQRSWEHPLGQSDRGMATLLSTLRTFTHITSGRNMDEGQQDGVLQILHLMTRLPPAVRTAYVLMRGETPQPSECAALSQCLYQVLKNVVPLATVQNDPRCFFEGSRLLFTLILSKAKKLRVTSSRNNFGFPYTTMRVHGLRNTITMLPVRGIAVQSKAGLVDTGLYDAFAEGGLLTWTNDNDTAKASSIDRQLLRAVTLSGGTKAKVVAFNVDAVAFTTRYPDNTIGAVVVQAEYSNLQYLATMCSNKGLSVLPPSDLPSASPLVLTLDRHGFLAVYVGREGCGGAPGKDILTFRPLFGEEAVDVSVITQLLVPILKRRKADGTAVFEAYGNHHRQTKDPEEAVVVCVDLSMSMNERCGFIDIDESEDADASINRAVDSISATITSLPVENPGGERLALDELKEYLSSHSSFEDMLAIVRTGHLEQHRHQNAGKVLQILGQLDQQQITAKTTDLEKTKRRATTFYYHSQVTASQLELTALSNRVARMKHFADSLCAFLTYRAENAASLPEPQVWRPGAVMPSAVDQQHATYTGPTFEIPAEFLCPISGELMDDPVMTIDNFTYERKNIERWFHTKKTSPLTNITLSSLDLRSDAQTKQKIDTYVQGTDIYTIKSTSVQTVFIKSLLRSWSMILFCTLTMRQLYELAFRLTKGRYTKLELRQKNAVLPSAGQTLESCVSTTMDVFIMPLDSTSSAADAKPGDMCLIKVYDSSSYSAPVCSYWGSSRATKTLASVVFRYYRHKFSKYSRPLVDQPLVIWHNVYSEGDGHDRGQTAMHWSDLSQFFNLQHCTRSVNAESMIDALNFFANPSSRLGTGPLVLKLLLDSAPPRKARQRRTLSRLNVLKQVFDAFINRLLAYNFQTHVSLVTFGTTVTVSQTITHAVENFRHQLNNMTTKGDTAIWDSIALASDQLQQYAAKYPKAKLRIICISDGEDNKSARLVHDLASQLVETNIVVDSFCLGDAENEALQTLSYMTKGYKFKPASLEEAMAICEMEPVLFLLERPDAISPRNSSRHAGNPLYRFQQAKKSVTVDHAMRDEFPQRKALPQLSESFVELKSFARLPTSQVRSDSNLRLSRIHTELRNCGALVHPHYDIYICEPNFGLWKLSCKSTYSGGTFLLYVEMGEDYPMMPPKARFVTSVYHPNINRHGRICHSILDRNWTVDTTTKDLVDTIYSLLLVPEFSDPINTVVTLNYHWDEVQFKEAQRHIRKHATKSRAQWRQEITG